MKSFLSEQAYFHVADECFFFFFYAMKWYYVLCKRFSLEFNDYKVATCVRTVFLCLALFLSASWIWKLVICMWCKILSKILGCSWSTFLFFFRLSSGFCCYVACASNGIDDRFVQVWFCSCYCSGLHTDKAGLVIWDSRALHGSSVFTALVGSGVIGWPRGPALTVAS